VSELASGITGDPELSRDGAELFFAADPVETNTKFELFVSRRTCTQAGP
jgi:hypothetical protein